ncbi:MAG: hypothetical protein GXO33_02425 [Epsilonproteobacteria bacterium]|nr:hypothetical protein [Campylobacterota bacterium]
MLQSMAQWGSDMRVSGALMAAGLLFPPLYMLLLLFWLTAAGRALGADYGDMASYWRKRVANALSRRKPRVSCAVRMAGVPAF